MCLPRASRTRLSQGELLCFGIFSKLPLERAPQGKQKPQEEFKNNASIITDFLKNLVGELLGYTGDEIPRHTDLPGSSHSKSFGALR